MSTFRSFPRVAIAGLFGAALAATPALANNAILGNTCTFLETIQTWIFGVAYVLGAIGLVLVAVSAFLGRFKFSHLIALGGGLFIVATADLLLTFVTGGDADAGGDCTAGAGGTP
jgi:TrbC/VIRB2 pilin